MCSEMPTLLVVEAYDNVGHRLGPPRLVRRALSALASRGHDMILLTNPVIRRVLWGTENVQ